MRHGNRTVLNTTLILGAAVWLAVLALTPAAAAEVLDAAAGGFTVRQAAEIKAPPERVYQALAEIGRWWDSAHTFSGDAANLSLDPRAGGCFCETLPGGGSVRHQEVVFAAPGKLLRLSGGLGPMQGMAVTGVTTWALQPATMGTALELTYTAGGYIPGGLEAMAPVVDQVLGGQVERLQRYLETGSANPPGVVPAASEPAPAPTAAPAPAMSGSVIYLVRHAETTGEGEDPALSAAGEARAAALTRLLGQVPLDAVYSTDTQRTRQTAQAIASGHGLEINLYDHRRLADLAATLRAHPGRYLVSGHSNTTPPLVELLGGDPGPELDHTWEYDRLYVLMLPAGGGPVATSMLRYGAPPARP